MFDLNAKKIVGITTLVATVAAAFFPKTSLKGLGVSVLAFTGLCTKYYGATAMECLKTGQYNMLASTVVGGSIFGMAAGMCAAWLGTVARNDMSAKWFIKDTYEQRITKCQNILNRSLHPQSLFAAIKQVTGQDITALSGLGDAISAKWGKVEGDNVELFLENLIAHLNKSAGSKGNRDYSLMLESYKNQLEYEYRPIQLKSKDDYRLATILGAAAFSATALYIGASEAAEFVK